MKYSKYSGSDRGLGERGRRRKKQTPLKGKELEELIAKNIAIENNSLK